LNLFFGTTYMMACPHQSMASLDSSLWSACNARLGSPCGHISS